MVVPAPPPGPAIYHLPPVPKNKNMDVILLSLGLKCTEGMSKDKGVWRMILTELDLS